MKRTATDPSHARNVRADDFENRLRDYLAKLTPAELGQVAAEAQRKTVARLNRSAIAGRIKEAREESGLTQEEMALAMHVYKRTWQNYENVKQPRIPWDRMEDIAEITGKPSEWLLHGPRETPNLMGVAHEETVESVREEFRPRVREIIDMLKAAEAERVSLSGEIVRQNEILQQQSEVLAELVAFVGQLPELQEIAQTIRALRGEGDARQRGRRALPEGEQRPPDEGNDSQQAS
jgi:transcriptional regulator with XRE-family HTH domain